MSKSSRSRRSVRSKNTDRSATVDVVSQLECAIRYPQATLIGALVGGVVPWFARTLAHVEVPAAWASNNFGLVAILLAVVLGCACFSALTVYKFGRATFGCQRKALGFVLAVEGVMIVSQGVTSTVALAILIAINALSNGSAIALARDATCRRREADSRRSATAQSRRQATAARRNNPIEVVEARTDVVEFPAKPARRATTRTHRRTVVVTPKWNDAMMDDDVIDVEMVSEQKFLA